VIEVIPNHRGKPLVYLHGRARKRAEYIELQALDISLTHSDGHAVAFAVGQSRDLEPEREAWRAKFAGILKDRGLLQ
jgi:holo-[acyl-carrier protein] synthase